MSLPRSKILFFFISDDHHRDLHSFPTRRSSDLPTSAPSSRKTPRPARDNRSSSRPATGRATRAATPAAAPSPRPRSEEHTSELQSQSNLVCRLLLEKKKQERQAMTHPRENRNYT